MTTKQKRGGSNPPQQNKTPKPWYNQSRKEQLAAGAVRRQAFTQAVPRLTKALAAAVVSKEGIGASLYNQGAKYVKDWLFPEEGAPTNTASLLTKSKILRNAGKAQVHTDVSGPRTRFNSERVAFHDLWNLTVQSDSVPTLAAPFKIGASYYGRVGITPANISARLGQVEELYQYYAFREVEIIYVSGCGSSTSGRIAIGVDMSAEYNSAATLPDAQQIMQHDISGSDNLWKGLKIKWKFDGSKVWPTSTVGVADADTTIQAVMLGAFIGVAPGIAYGGILVRGIIDFYDMSELVTNPSLQEENVWRRFFMGEWLRYRFSPNSERVPFNQFIERYGSDLKLRERNKVLRSRQSQILVPYHAQEAPEESKTMTKT